MTRRLYNIFLLLAMCFNIAAQKTDSPINSSLDSVFMWFRNANYPTLKFGTLKVENYSASISDSLIQISLSKPFKNVNLREDAIKALKDSISKKLPAPYKKKAPESDQSILQKAAFHGKTENPKSLPMQDPVYFPLP